VQAIALAHAGVGVVIVVLLLCDPQADGVGASERAGALGKVLTVGSIGMHKAAVADPLVHIALGIGSKRAVPCHVRHPNLLPSSIVRVEIVLG